MAEKRKVGRPRKSDATPSKKVKLEDRSEASTPEQDTTPVKQEEEAAEEENREPTPLPNRIYDSKPLPTISKHQEHATLSNEEYQSISVSNTFYASLERSRQRWLAGEFLEKYWVKATNRKDAKNPPPPNNPQKTWMRELGPCIIIVEPLMLEATIFYSREPALVAAAQAPQLQHPMVQGAQTGSAAPSPYGTPYRPQHQHQQTPVHKQSGKSQRTTTPQSNVPTPSTNQHPHPTLQHTTQPLDASQTAIPASSTAPVTPAPVQEKPSPDPVIQLLATRASSDRELKELMKVVATGHADPEQLRRFQRHIDELNLIVQSQKSQAQAQAQQTASPAITPSSGPSRVSTPQMQQPHAQSQPQYQQPQIQQRPIAVPPAQRRPAVTPNYPVVIEFAGTGASQDRFLFPPYSIVEPLGSLSILASFLVFRKGSQAADSSLVDAEAEYFEPVTVKIDVEPRHREILEYMKRSVRPQEEVRQYMEDKMRTCKRAPLRALPLRLPHKSQITEPEEPVEEPVIEIKKKTAKKEKVATPEVPTPAPEPAPLNDGPAGMAGRRRRKTVQFGDGV
ncbi:hypothetical protein MBLNU457_4696t1 [Dothideomycetes sp. NU457]